MENNSPFKMQEIGRGVKKESGLRNIVIALAAAEKLGSSLLTPVVSFPYFTHYVM